MTESTIRTYEAMAKFDLGDEARKYMLEGMNELEDSFKTLQTVDTGGVTPLVSVLDMQNVLREDVSNQLITRDELMSNAVEEYDGYFQVPKTLE